MGGNLPFLPVSGSPSRVRLCGGCLRRFGDLRKNTPWIFGACILWILLFVNDFRVPQPCASVSQLPAALRRSQKKHAPGFLEYVSCGCCRCLSMFGSQKWYRHMTPTRDEPTTATPSSHQQAPRTGTKYPAQGTHLTLIYRQFNIFRFVRDLDV